MPAGATYQIWACVEGVPREMGTTGPTVGGMTGCPAGYNIAKVNAYVIDPANALDVDAAISAQSVWNMTPEQGGEIAVAILGVWACAWGFKIIARFLSTLDEGKENEST